MIVFPDLSPEDQEDLNALVAEKVYADLDDGTDADILSAYASRFPRWTLLMEPVKCAMTLRQLEEKALDYYQHLPSVLEKFVLVRSMEDWAAFLEEGIEAPALTLHDTEAAQARMPKGQATRIRHFMAQVCPRPDLLYNVEPLINDALQGGDAHKAEGIRLQDYFDILPPDVKDRLRSSS